MFFVAFTQERCKLFLKESRALYLHGLPLWESSFALTNHLEGKLKHKLNASFNTMTRKNSVQSYKVVAVMDSMSSTYNQLQEIIEFGVPKIGLVSIYFGPHKLNRFHLFDRTPYSGQFEYYPTISSTVKAESRGAFCKVIRFDKCLDLDDFATTLI